MSKLKPIITALVLSLAILMSLVGVSGAASTGGAVVSIAVDQASYTSSQGVIVHVTITNPNKHPIKVLKWYTPAEDVEEALLAVTRDGNAVSFMGPHYKRPAPTGNDYVNLKSGESLTRDINLGNYYDLSVSGAYQISYNIASTNLYSEKGNELKTTDALKSNSVDVSIEGRAAPLFEAAAVSGSTTYNKCTAAQQSDLVAARNQASTYAANSLAYLNAGTQGPRYTTWFGAYDASRYNTAKSHYTNISNAMDTAPVKFDCGCKKTYYAYVYPNQPYTIYLCKAFWTAPLTGTDSRAGTLIHEMSHFTVVAGTDDLGYGQTNAKNLALTDPNKALNNADNHEYFAENTPFQN